jgi:hypothetical protein
VYVSTCLILWGRYTVSLRAITGQRLKTTNQVQLFFMKGVFYIIPNSHMVLDQVLKIYGREQDQIWTLPFMGLMVCGGRDNKQESYNTGVITLISP